MDLWNRITGMILLEITAADPERFLNLLTQRGIALWDIKLVSRILFHCRIQRRDWDTLSDLAEKMGVSVEPLGAMGLVYRFRTWLQRPIVLVCVTVLVLLTLLLPECILFVDVQGNEQIPARMILEEAEKQGLRFGASRRALRSEEIKNELLGAMEELEWVGVNTMGCRAVIRVRERNQEEIPEKEEPGSLVAAADGIIDQIEMHRGTLLCKLGQAVKKGDVLVSGFTDLGICSRICDAQAEIYAMTTRVLETAALPQVVSKGDAEKESLRISLIFGKKRINLYSDSGILPPGCGKMTYTYPLRLPGGDTLPVCLVVERVVWYNTKNIMRSQETAQRLMEETARQYLLDQTIAADILGSQTEMEYGESGVFLQVKFQCREMIARYDTGIILEGDTQDDSQNSQRGAG